MTSVWVVEQGDYSDYRVVGVFSSAKNARKVSAAINRSGEDYSQTTVAKWPIDPAVEQLNAGLKRFHVLMLRDGSVEHSSTSAVTGYNLETTFSIWSRSTAPAYRGTDTKDALTAEVWAKDVEHAIKITNEARTRMIAQGEWK